MARENKEERVVVAKGVEQGNEAVEILAGHTVAQRIRKEEGLGFSEIVSTMNGQHPKLVFPETQVSYKIIDGEGIFKFSEGQELMVCQGAIITIASGIVYSFEGDFKCFMRCDPGFTPESSILVDDYNEEFQSKKQVLDYKEYVLFCSDEQQKQKCSDQGRVTYSIFEGKANFIVDGEEHTLVAGDVITIPKYKNYAYCGHFNAYQRIDLQEAKVNEAYKADEDDSIIGR